MSKNTKNIIDDENIQKAILENMIQELDEYGSEKIKAILELPDELIKKWVNDSYQELLKQNSHENTYYFRKKANPKKLKSELTDKVIENIEEEDDSSKTINKFIQKADNKFILSQEKIQNLSDKELDEKLFEIGIFQNKYKNSNEFERKELRQQHPLSNFEDFTKDLQEAINSKLSEENSVFNSEWAENHNEWKINWDVYKLTKGRHDNDYFSILQLVKFMIALERDFRSKNEKLKKEWKNIEIRNANEGVIFYTDENWNYKRLIKQSFAPWESVDVAMKKELHNAQWEFLKKNPKQNCIWSDPKCKYKKIINLDDKLDDILPVDFNTYLEETKSPLFQAYKDFLQSIQNISDEKWYLLDISDSRQWWKTRRWNILNTSNVFVKEENWKYIFTVIDPDVFNKDWESKFDWKEQENAILEKLESKKVLSYIDKFKARITWIMTEVTNFARDWWKKESKIAVAPKQEMYMSKILNNKEYNLEVDEKLKNDLIFWTNMSRLAFRRFKEDEDWNITPMSDTEITDNETKHNKTIENLEDAWRQVKILDYYPKNSEEEKSWFGWVFIEVDWEKYFMPKWTKKEKGWTLWGKDTFFNYKKADLKADAKMVPWIIPWLNWYFPLDQVKSMIDFFDRIEKEDSERFNIIWDSLGWILGQIFNIMYSDKVSDAKYLHSPWALNLEISDEEFNSLDEKYKEKIQKYRDFKNTWVPNKVTYLDWTNRFRPISWLWKKLASKDTTSILEVAGWKLHTMPQLIAHMKNIKIWEMVHVNEVT